MIAKPPAFELCQKLEEAARRAEERKRQAIERLVALLDPKPPETRFGFPMQKVNGDD